MNIELHKQFEKESGIDIYRDVWVDDSDLIRKFNEYWAYIKWLENKIISMNGSPGIRKRITKEEFEEKYPKLYEKLK